MAEKAKKTTKKKKPTVKTTKTLKTTKTVKKPAVIKSSVTGKKEVKKPGAGKIVCLCAIVISLLVITVAVMLNGWGLGKGNLFVSDSTKYVLNVKAEEDDEDKLAETHIIYYYKDDDITGVKFYYEFLTAEDAKTAYDALVADEDVSEEEKNTYQLSGKFIIATPSEEEYSELKASEIKAYIDLYEKYQNGELTEEDTEEESEEE